MTPRQLRILTLAAYGYTMDGIGSQVALSAWSVKNELVRVRDRLRARNTAHAVAIAMRRGLLPGAGNCGRRLPHGARPTGTGWPT